MVNNSIVDLDNTTATTNPLANSATGIPDNTQNAVWDNEGNLKFYEEDGYVYNSVGQHVNAVSWSSNPNPPTKGHSEFIFVPVPGECNEWYGITLDRIDEDFIKGYEEELILSFSIFDGNANEGQGGVKILPETTFETIDWISIDETRGVSQCVDKFHLGVTQLQEEGLKRYLFATACNNLMIFEITNSGIQEIFKNQFTYKGEIVLRSELEIYEKDDHISVAFPTVVRINSTDGPKEIGGIDVFNFNTIAGPLYLDFYQEIALDDPSQSHDVTIVKGLEFSGDGSLLYASFVNYNRNIIYSDPACMTLVSEVLNFSRPALSSQFTQITSLNLGGGNEDFSLGMIERDRENRLWFIGDERMGFLMDSDNPSSTFYPNVINLDTRITTHHPIWPSSFNVFTRIRLLPDQVDGEHLEETLLADQYPETLTVCDLPYQMSSTFIADWDLAYYSDNDPPVYMLQNLGSGLNMPIPYEGTVYVKYSNPNGCEVRESVEVIWDPISQHGADFTYESTVQNNSLQIATTPLANQGTSHQWTLYLNNAGSWIAINSSTSIAPVFTNLNPSLQYKLEHTITPIQPYMCMYNPVSTEIIN
ncbi:MAG: hypothetical protein ACPGVC_11090 [Salibacteraceae bacterium]